MASEIVINITERETRLALIENGQVAEINLNVKANGELSGTSTKAV